MSKSFTRLAALALILGAGLIAAGCGGGDGDSTSAEAQTPSEVVAAFYAATADGDNEELCSYFSEETAKQAAEEENADSCEEAAESGLSDSDTTDLAKTVEVGDEKIDGDTATVEVSSSEQEGSGSINLVKEDGEWKIDFTN